VRYVGLVDDVNGVIDVDPAGEQTRQRRPVSRCDAAAHRPQPAMRADGPGRGAAVKRPATLVCEASDARSCGDACRLPAPWLRR